MGTLEEEHSNLHNKICLQPMTKFYTSCNHPKNREQRVKTQNRDIANIWTPQYGSFKHPLRGCEMFSAF